MTLVKRVAIVVLGRRHYDSKQILNYPRHVIQNICLRGGEGVAKASSVFGRNAGSSNLLQVGHLFCLHVTLTDT